MSTAADGFHRINVQVGATRTDWYFDSDEQANKACGYAYTLGVRVNESERVPTLPPAESASYAKKFYATVLAEIMADPKLRAEHRDTLDALYNTRVIEVRNALRALGWDGGTYNVLSKDGAKAVFKYEHTVNGRNVVGMSINGIDDDLSLPAAHIAAEVTKGAQEHLKRNRSLEIALTAQDGSKGSYDVILGDGDEVLTSPIKWQPCETEAATHEVCIRMREYGRRSGTPYVMSGDAWRELESEGEPLAMWKNMLLGMPAEQAIYSAMNIAEEPQPSGDVELDCAKSFAARYGLTSVRVASGDDKLPTVGPITVITRAYIIQDVGMGSGVLHPADKFDQLPVMGSRFTIRYEAGKALVAEGRTQQHLFSR